MLHVLFLIFIMFFSLPENNSSKLFLNYVTFLTVVEDKKNDQEFAITIHDRKIFQLINA